MNVEITITLNSGSKETIDALIEVIKAAGNNSSLSVVNKEIISTGDLTEYKPLEKKKAAIAKAEEIEPEETATTSELSFEKVKDLATKLITDGKQAQVKAIREKFGLEKMSQLKPEKFAAFYAALTKIA